MQIDWRTEWPHWLLLAGMFGLAAITWPTAPEQIPIHWNLEGQVDAYGNRFVGLLTLPLLALGLYAVLLWLPRLDPSRSSYAAFAGAYNAIRLAALAVLAVVYGMVHLWLRGQAVDVRAVVAVASGGFFLVIGGAIGRVQPNWFVGIRTPWTLASARAWERTHRLGGRVFLGVGLLLIAAGLSGSAWALLLAIGAAVVGALGLIAYSYLAWRDDPERVPALGRRPADEGEAGP